jgi:acyl-CoA synthetase (AMP-forming)/AMP-acid ligase II
MTQRTTLADLLFDPVSAAPAIRGVSPPLQLTYQALAEQVERLAGQLRSAGIEPGGCVAMILPNSPAFLVLLLALVRARLTAAPLDPASKADELRVLLEDLHSRAIITDGSISAVSEVASGLGLPVWQVDAGSSEKISLPGPLASPQRSLEPPLAGDVALILHTSGTTSRPKAVPLTHANVLHSVLTVAAHYALTPADGSLVVLPLFHGHGLIGAALAALASGGTAIVAPRFSASQFWVQYRTYHATWYTAVPTIHQILLGCADRDGAPDQGIRFIRSCSSALAPSVLASLEKRFCAPVLEAYGMTEAAHQVASNPLPPRARKPGSVGMSTGVELAVVDEKGTRLKANSPGEVVVRGTSVMRGYLDNPEANANAFLDGWFRTGDLGAFDGDGYLSLTGRIKELINRGGEKIAPAEIEDVLLAHPAVAEAAAFGVPDPKYGEEVWAAVVLKGDVDADQLQAFCRTRLADFKVPKVIRILPALPRNALGKVERLALTALFAPTAS